MKLGSWRGSVKSCPYRQLADEATNPCTGCQEGGEDGRQDGFASAASSRPASERRSRASGMLWRLIISLSVVGLRPRSLAASFCTPPVASSVDSMMRRSKLAITSRRLMPSGGTETGGGWEKAGAVGHG